MTKQDFYNLLKQLQSDTQNYAQGIPIAFKDYAVAKITIDRSIVYPLISSNNWSGLKSYSQSRISEIELKIQSMQIHQTQINALIDRLYNLKSGFQDFYHEPQSQQTWATLKTTLEAELINVGISQNQTDAFLNNLGAKGGVNAYNYQKSQYSNIANLLNYAFERHLALYMYHFSCIVYADYNLIGNINQTMTYNVSAKITNLLNSIRNKHNIIYQNTKIVNVNNVINNTNSFTTWLSLKIQTDIIPIVAYCNQKKNANNTAFKTDGKRAMKAGMLLQSALFSISACKWIAWTGKWHKELKLSADLFSAANKLTNNAILWTGNKVAISTLSSNPNLHDNKDVIISGVIKNLNIIHLSATKVLSIAEIVNSNGKIIKLSLPHIKIDSGGLVNGSYAEISGKFLISNPEANGNPAISVNRLAIKEVAKINWTAWLRYQLRDIFQPISHNLELNFSLEMGNYGAVNPVKFDTTYSKPNLFSLKPNIF